MFKQIYQGPDRAVHNTMNHLFSLKRKKHHYHYPCQSKCQGNECGNQPETLSHLRINAMVITNKRIVDLIAPLYLRISLDVFPPRSKIVEGSEIAELAAPCRTGKDNRAEEKNCHYRELTPVDWSGENHHGNRKMKFPCHQKFIKARKPYYKL